MNWVLDFVIENRVPSLNFCWASFNSYADAIFCSGVIFYKKLVKASEFSSQHGSFFFIKLNAVVVCDRNQVSVVGTETKVQFWYRNRFLFFQKPKLFFQFFFFSIFQFFLFFPTFGGIQVL